MWPASVESTMPNVFEAVLAPTDSALLPEARLLESLQARLDCAACMQSMST